jgi:hypothetical protein
VLPSDFVSKANGGTFDGNLTINIADNGSAPAMTSTLNLRGFEGRGAGIKIKDSANSAADSSNREWFIGSGYSQSGFNIGYSATASQSSYAAQNKFTLTTAGNATFAGTVAGTNLSGTNTGDQTLPTDFVSATTGGNFGGDITVYTGAGTGSLSVGREAGQSIKLYITDTSNSITAAQDSDGNQAHNFILNRTFAGTGDNNFKIQKGGTDQFTLNSAGLATFAGSVQITGALTVNGTTTTINTATVEVEDNILQLNTTQGTPDTATATTSGISIYRGVDENDVAITEASLIFDDADDTWDLTNNLTVAGDVIGASFAVPSGASTGFLKADGTVDSTTYSGFTFGATDLTFSGADPGDIVWRNADGDEVHRLWSGTNDYLTYRNDAGTTYELISAGSTSYNNSNWDTAYTHSLAAHAPTDAEANVYSTATELLTGLNTLTNPIFTGGLSKKNTRYHSGITSEYPLGHYSPGETLFEIDPTWNDAELKSYFNSTNVSWATEANAPGGYSIYINGNVGVGSAYSSGFPLIPIDEDATYYQECWIKNAGSGQTHYMGSTDIEADLTYPDSGAGNPGSYGYWVMSNQNPTTTWTKVSGYITGHHASNTGAFETNATYFSPLALFNWGAGTGTRACYISGWKVIRVDKVGDRIFQDDVQVKGKLEVHTLDANTSSTTALVMNVNEVEKRTLGSLAFSNATVPPAHAGLYLPIGGGTLTGNLQVDNTLSVGSGSSRFIWHSGNSYVSGSGTANATEIDWKDSTHYIPSLAYAFKVRLVTTGTGTDTGASYIVYYNNTTSAWVVRYITLAGTSSNHARLTMVTDGTGTYMAAYHTHSGGYNIRYFVETFDSGDQDMDGHTFGSDFHWQRDNDTLSYSEGNIIINGSTDSNGAVTPRTLDFTTNPTEAGLAGSSGYQIGEISFTGKDSSTNASGKYGRIRGSIVDSNTTVQGSGGEGGKIQFTLLKHDAGAQPRVEYDILTLDPLVAEVDGQLEVTGNIQLTGGGTIEAPSVNGGEDLILKAAGGVDVIIDSNGNGGDNEIFRVMHHTSAVLFEVQEGGEVRFQDGIRISGTEDRISSVGSSMYIGGGGFGNSLVQFSGKPIPDSSYSFDFGASNRYWNQCYLGTIHLGSTRLSNQQNTDVSGLEMVASVLIASYTAAFFDFVIKKGTNVRSGTVYACHDGTNVEFTETSTNDLGDTSDVVLSVDISGTDMRLLADAATSGWSVKSLIRAI